ncbi:hypothetical protein GGE65_001298 [Skermanella aerolata]
MVIAFSVEPRHRTNLGLGCCAVTLQCFAEAEALFNRQKHWPGQEPNCAQSPGVDMGQDRIY